jgi:hypothetical protein
MAWARAPSPRSELKASVNNALLGRNVRLLPAAAIRNQPDVINFRCWVLAMNVEVNCVSPILTRNKVRSPAFVCLDIRTLEANCAGADRDLALFSPRIDKRSGLLVDGDRPYPLFNGARSSITTWPLSFTTLRCATADIGLVSKTASLGELGRILAKYAGTKVRACGTRLRYCDHQAR